MRLCRSDIDRKVYVVMAVGDTEASQLEESALSNHHDDNFDFFSVEGNMMRIGR